VNKILGFDPDSVVYNKIQTAQRVFKSAIEISLRVSTTEGPILDLGI
jgi:hypothetical protein